MRYLDQYAIAAGTIDALLSPQTLDERRKAARNEAKHHDEASDAHRRTADEWRKLADQLDDEYWREVNGGVS